MAINFAIHGPFIVPTNAKQIKGGKEHIQQLNVSANLWKEKFFSDYADKKGCYVFANAVGKGSKPIYVGKTNRTFKDECFSTHKKKIIDEFLMSVCKTGLQIYFIVLNNRKDCSDEIDLCETLLIQKCKDANPNLLNVRKLSEIFTIKSFHRDKNKPTADVTEFKKCLNLNQMKGK